MSWFDWFGPPDYSKYVPKAPDLSWPWPKQGCICPVKAEKTCKGGPALSASSNWDDRSIERREMSESEIRNLLIEIGVSPENVERVMEAVADYARERESEGASDAIREYEERF
jgi:hypothetical protein